MAKRKKSEFSRQRERIYKIRKRIESKGYEIIEDIYIPTTKEINKMGGDIEEWAKYLKSLTPKKVKQEIRLLDKETGVLFNAGDIAEIEKEKKAEDNTASFVNYIYDEINKIFMTHYVVTKTGMYISKEDINDSITNFKQSILTFIENNRSDRSYVNYLLEHKEEITTLAQEFDELRYYEEVLGNMSELASIIMNRKLTIDESQAISDWSDSFNAEHEY